MVSVKVPLVPVTLRKYSPAAVELVVLMVSVELPDPAIEIGLNVAEAPAGNPGKLNDILPVKPLTPAAFTV